VKAGRHLSRLVVEDINNQERNKRDGFRKKRNFHLSPTSWKLVAQTDVQMSTNIILKIPVGIGDSPYDRGSSYIASLTRTLPVFKIVT
jgi:hypothetical protein